LATSKNAIVVGAHNRVTFQLTYRFIPLTTIVYREIKLCQVESHPPLEGMLRGLVPVSTSVAFPCLLFDELTAGL
jgi:hypothetical protein